MTAHELERAFRSKGELRGGILFLRPKDAVSLIEAAREHGIRVLGIDGFILTAQTTQPVMERSIDLTRARIEDPWSAATSFVRQYDDTKYRFEVVLG